MAASVWLLALVLRGVVSSDDGLYPTNCSFSPLRTPRSKRNSSRATLEVEIVTWNLADWESEPPEDTEAHGVYLLSKADADFFVVQESIHTTLLQSTLHGYCVVGEGRDDHTCPCPAAVVPSVDPPLGEGERAAIFHNHARWNILDTTTYFVSGYAEGWSYPRVFTVGNYQHIESGNTLRIVDVHLPTKSNADRQEVYLASIIELGLADITTPLVILGDWNVLPEDVTDRLAPLRAVMVPTSYLSDDICDNCHTSKCHDGFDKVLSNRALKSAECWTDYDDYLSDHGPVYVTLDI